VSPSSSEASHDERADLGDPLVVAIDMDDAEVVMECGLGDEEIRERRAMPHPVVVGEVELNLESELEDVNRCRDAGEAVAKLGSKRS
jgi:hypothetical protein